VTVKRATRQDAWNLRRWAQAAIAPEKLDYQVEWTRGQFRATCLSFRPENANLVAFSNDADAALSSCRSRVRTVCLSEVDRLLDLVAGGLPEEGEGFDEQGPRILWSWSSL
jgi:hypothetical protein